MNFESSENNLATAVDLPAQGISKSKSHSTLRERRQILAQPLADDAAQDDLEIVVFYLGEQSPQNQKGATENAAMDSDGAGVGAGAAFGQGGFQYAFETAQVSEVFALPAACQIAALPGTPPWVRGILNVRGRILAVLDLQCLFGLPLPQNFTLESVLILRGAILGEAAAKEENESPMPMGDVAIATGGAVGVRRLPRSQLETGHALEGTPGARYLRGLTPDGIAVLDAVLLLGDGQLVVQSE